MAPRLAFQAVPITLLATVMSSCGDGTTREDPSTGAATSASSTRGATDESGAETTTSSDSSSGDTGSTTIGPTSTATTATTGEASDDDGGVRFDTPSGGEAGDEGTGGAGCKKVDFLFVIDNSGSMTPRQDNLIRSFPGFVSAIVDTLGTHDFHIMVVESDAASYAACSEPCKIVDTCEGMACAVIAPPVPQSPCDDALGGGTVLDMYDHPCGVDGGGRFIVDGQADLESTFACIARVGSYGYGDEQPVRAMVESVTTLNAPGACNEGFLRDDAILVVTIVTDALLHSELQDDSGVWFDRLVAAKGGNAEAIVLLALIRDELVPGAACPECAPGGMLPPGACQATAYRDLVGRFGDQGVLYSVCEPEYAPFFLEAVATIDLACDTFIPPG